MARWLRFASTLGALKLLAADELGLAFVQHISWVYKQGGDSRLKGMLAYSVRMEHLARYSRDMGEIWGETGRLLDRLATRLEMRNTDPRLRSVPRLLSSTQGPSGHAGVVQACSPGP